MAITKITTNSLGSGVALGNLNLSPIVFTQSVSISSGSIKTDNGSNSTPSISFTSDTDTGLYLPSPNQIGITTGGVGRILVSSTGITMNLPISNNLTVSGVINGSSINLTGNIVVGGSIQAASATIPIINGNTTFSNNIIGNGTDNTLPNQTAESSSSIITRGLGDTRYGEVVSAYTTTNFDRSLDIVSSADPVLQLPLTQGTWEIRGLVILAETIVTNSVGVRARINVSNATSLGSSFFMKMFLGGSPSALTSFVRPTTSLNITFPSPELSSTSSRAAFEISAIINTNSSGIFSFEWAQNVSSADAVRRFAGSYLTATRIGI